MSNQKDPQSASLNKVRSYLKDLHDKGKLNLRAYDGEKVSPMSLFVIHGWTTREIGHFMRVGEPLIRKTILTEYDLIRNQEQKLTHRS